MYYKYTTTFKNIYGESVYLADGCKIVAIGDEAIKSFCAKLKQECPTCDQDLGGTGYDLLEIVRPKETVSHRWECWFDATPEQTKTEDEINKEFAALFFAGQTK